MEIYLASANPDEIRKAYDLPIAGVLTNSSIIKKEGRVLPELVEEIDQIGDLPFGLQIAATDLDEMMGEARLFQSLIHNRTLHLKIPYCPDAFKVICQLRDTELTLNLTGVSTLSQALLALESGIDYLSIYVGRVTDAGGDGVQLLEKIKYYADYHAKPTRIVAASIRNLEHLEEVALAGADAVAIPFPLLLETMRSPVTDQSVDGFKKDWGEVDLGEKP
jgi:transaldolase